MGLSNPLHVLILVLVVVLLFGARRLPELGRSLGSGIREFKGGIEARDRDPADQTQVAGAAPEAPSASRPTDPVAPGPGA